MIIIYLVVLLDQDLDLDLDLFINVGLGLKGNYSVKSPRDKSLPAKSSWRQARRVSYREWIKNDQMRAHHENHHVGLTKLFAKVLYLSSTSVIVITFEC